MANVAYDQLLAAVQDPTSRRWLPPPTPLTLEPPSIVPLSNQDISPPSQHHPQDIAATATTGQAQRSIDTVFTYCWKHCRITRTPNNTQLYRIHTSVIRFSRAQEHQMSSTLTNMLEGNATVYKETRNPNRGRRDGGRRNGRRRGGIYSGRRDGCHGGRQDYTHSTASQPNTAVSPPPQYAQAMVMPTHIAPGTVMSPPMDPPPMGYPQPYPYAYRPPGF